MPPTTSRRHSAAILIVAALLLVAPHARATQDVRVDVLVYGATSGGVVAAIRAAAGGASVALVEPTDHVGGLTASGLGATDIGNKGAIGGLSREFYRRVGDRYGKAEAWTFEPHVAEEVFDAWLREAGPRLAVLRGERLDLDAGVVFDGPRLRAIRLESGVVAEAAVFVDASYEGDLMAKAGVAYRVGREGNDEYGETLNGVQTGNAVHHQFVRDVDPYVVPGDPSSGLLFGVAADGPGEEGAADLRVQAYCFRLCATNDPANRVPWPRPADYDEARYELLLRNFEAGDLRRPWHPVPMPNAKTDSNNNFAISTDFLGASDDYPDADHETRAQIVARHRSWQEGLMWTLANHPRVPAEVRDHFTAYGLAADEFVDNGHWPRLLYIREARRMVGGYVMTQHDCQGRRAAADPIGLAAYTMDSHNVQRYVDARGFARNEGDVQVGGFPPYPISYRAITPPRAACRNLLVPVALSATHIAYGSIRMEPVFMVLGHSAAVAAELARELGVAVQDVPYERLRDRLLAEDQVLEWSR